MLGKGFPGDTSSCASSTISPVQARNWPRAQWPIIASWLLQVR